MSQVMYPLPRITCLEVDGPEHLSHMVHIDGEVVHALIARLWAAAQ